LPLQQKKGSKGSTGQDWEVWCRYRFGPLLQCSILSHFKSRPLLRSDGPATPSTLCATRDPASGVVDRLAAVEGSLDAIQDALRQLGNQNLPPAPAPAAPAPAPGPDFSAPHPAPKTVLQPNPPAVFDGGRTQGQMFLYSVLTYYRLVPEAFMADGFISQEKLVQFAMSFMSKDAAARWAERRTSTVPFPFPTWAQFEAEFQLWFVEERVPLVLPGLPGHLLVHGRLRGTGRNGRLLGCSHPGHQVPLWPRPTD
jgi:hypothetical protein